MSHFLKYKDEDWEEADPKEIIFNLISEKSFVLDLGCWTGRLGEKLKKEKKCQVIGIDIDNKAIKIANERLDRVYKINLNEIVALRKVISGKIFDYILLVDVIEHLLYPEKLLDCLLSNLKENGRVVVSLPNIANYKIRLDLFLGKFNYTDQGILDKSHLRFYTLSSAKRLLNKTGYKIEQLFYTRTKILPKLLAEQFIFVCKK